MAMKVSAILDSKGRSVATVRSDAVLSHVVRRLKLEGIGAFVVSDDGQHVDGMISERDIVRALAGHGAELLELRVRDLMTRSVITCTPEDTIKHVMTVMTQHRIRHLPVVVGGRLAGICSIGDVVKNRLEEVELEANVLRDAYIASH
jgi:CBS domain-containing protein